MLSERQRMILNTIINDYIYSAEPVGSRSISKKTDVSCSPATIRNEMADLEELGYLEQPHTSAGRIPSHKGYRYYVDHLSPSTTMGLPELDVIRGFFSDQLNEFEQVLQYASSILSSMTNYTSISLGSEVFHTSLRHFKLLPLEHKQAVAIIVTNNGRVESKMIQLPSGVSVGQMENVIALLNDKLVGVPLYKLKSRLYNELAQELALHISQYEEVMQVLDCALHHQEEQSLFVSGTTNILSQPEFKDIDKVKHILDFLEETTTLTQLMSSMTDEAGVSVRIGNENNHEAFSDCSLVTASYSLDGEVVGTIGILGPTRMEYARVISILDFVSDHLTNMMNHKFKR